jgi:hypothetical protein
MLLERCRHCNVRFAPIATELMHCNDPPLSCHKRL